MEDRKWWKNKKKWDNRNYFNFPSFCLVESEKVEGWTQWVRINLLIYPFLKNDVELKQKHDKQPKNNNNNHSNLLKNKNYV